MSTLVPADVESYKVMRHAEGAANSTLNRELEVLRHAYFGKDQGLVTSILKIKKLEEHNTRTGFFEPAAFASVMKHLTRIYGSHEEPAPDLQLACLIAYTYGWRITSEGLILARHQVDMVEGTIRIDPGVTKNKDGRVVYLTPQVRDAMAAHLATLDEWQHATGKITPWLFINTKPKHLAGARLRHFWKSWRRACVAAGYPHMLRHDFRRTAVRNMVNSGVSETVAMKVTGHRTRAVFDRYNIVSPTDLERAARLIGEAQTNNVGHSTVVPIGARGA